MSDEATAVSRELLHMASTAREIALDLKYAGEVLESAFEGYRDEADAKAGALALLYSACDEIADLRVSIRALYS